MQTRTAKGAAPLHGHEGEFMSALLVLAWFAAGGLSFLGIVIAALCYLTGGCSGTLLGRAARRRARNDCIAFCVLFPFISFAGCTLAACLGANL